MAGLSLSLWWIWLSLSVLRSNASKDKINATAESGQDVNLTCRAPGKDNAIIVVEWSRADLGTKYISLYRGRKFVPDHQHPSFKDRVDLQDRQMKDGDFSVILKNVTTADSGTYECRVETKTNRRKRANLDGDPISSINLHVVPPGQQGGHTEDGGKEDGGKEDGSVGLRRGHFPLIASLSFICAVCILITVKYFYPTRDKATDTQQA
ncbi:nectin-4-like [Neolamprologus brichardi]|uniref:nectin-4-like n=1 Tax=Neolamprologus brichardi TaxID=32507 RepID=UPI0003EBE5C4|nr:nectin-4-like [Neolamprologus brichardi]